MQSPLTPVGTVAASLAVALAGRRILANGETQSPREARPLVCVPKGASRHQRESVSQDSMLVHPPSPRARESDTRCTGLDSDRPEATRCQFGLTRVCCQLRLTDMNAEDITSAITSNDPALGLRASLALHRLAERVEADHVAAAREKGWSWQQIGDALGVTRQSVHTKYNKDSS
jgi:hypothetical protein